MRRRALFCAVCVAVVATSAQAAARPSFATSVQRHTAAPTKKLHKRLSARVGPGHTTRSGAVFGDQAVEPGRGSNPAGWAQAAPFTSHATASVSSIVVYVDPRSRATALVAGLYTEADGQPASLLTRGSVEHPKDGSWDIVPVRSARVVSGSAYWVAILARGGTVYLRDRNPHRCSSGRFNHRALKTLPASWALGEASPFCRVSAYVVGAVVSNRGAPASTAPVNIFAPTFPDPPAIRPPVDVLAPTISGTVIDGQTLTASDGTWLSSPTSSVSQWQDCDVSGANCSNIALATNTEYTLADSDIGHTIRVLVTAANAAGSASAMSSQTGEVAGPPAPTSRAAPVVSGSAVQGDTLSTTNGSWTRNPRAYGYAWQDCDSSGGGCSNISGATSSSYTLASGDVGHTIRAVVTAVNAGGSASASSNPTAVVAAVASAPPSNTARPVISGTATQGDTLTTSNGSWSGSPTSYSYAWQDCDSSGGGCSNISGATSSSYTLRSSDVGHTIVVVVTASNSGGSGQATSASVGPVSAEQQGQTTQTTGCAPPAGQTMTNTVSHLCGFADTTNTGVPAGTTLYSPSGGPTANTGSGWSYSNGLITTAANGALIKNVTCTCGVDVTNSGVTIEDSDLEVSGQNSWVIQLRHASSTTVLNNNLHGAGVPSPQGCDSAIRDIYADSDSLTVKNNNVWYCADPMNNIANGGLIEQNYFHDFGSSTSSNHYEDIQTEPGDGQLLTIQDNTFFNQNDQTAAIILSNDGGGTETNRVINHNLLAGGGYTFYGAGGPSTPSNHITFTNNSFSPMYFSDSGYFGAFTYWTSGNSNVWSGNIWDNNGTALAP